MRTATIILSGLSVLAAAQTTTTDIGGAIESGVSSVLSSISSVVSNSAGTPEEQASRNSVAYSIATAAQGAQSSIIAEAESSVLAAQNSAMDVVASLSFRLSTATGAGASNISKKISSITAAAGPMTSSLASQTSDLAGSVSDAVSSATDTDNAAAPTNMPVAAAAALGGVGMVVLGLL